MDEEKVVLRENSLACEYCGKFCKEPFECLNCHLGYCRECVQMTEECNLLILFKINLAFRIISLFKYLVFASMKVI